MIIGVLNMFNLFRPKRASKSGIELIKKFEGCRLRAYRCSAGVLTIGYGHTGRDVKVGQEITLERAEELLRADLARFEDGVYSNVKPKLKQYQFDALVSFAYNVGVGAFKRSTLLKCINKKDYEAAAKQFPRWNRAGGRVIRGLSRRRALERDLFEGKSK